MGGYPPTLLCRDCGGGIRLPADSSGGPVRCPDCGRRYDWDDGVLVFDPGGDQGDYPEDVYALLTELETRHFWFSGRNDVIVSILRRSIGALAGRSVLDVGCGTGFVLAALEGAGMRTCGLDMHLTGLRHARRRVRGVLLRQTAACIPFRSQFDVVTLCDVIEHASDDTAVLREAASALGEGGVVLVTVPAHPRLWTALDEAAGHKRRYTARTLRRALEGAGLRVLTARHFNVLLLPVQALQRWLLPPRRQAAPGEERLELIRRSLRVPPGPLNRLFRVAMAADIPLSYAAVPFGASLIAVGERT